MPNRSIGRLVAGVIALYAGAAARAQLSQDQVLVVYDSRIPDSRAVAEHYAGSRKVPGGSGNQPGVRPGVWVCDLAATGASATAPGNIAYADFVTRMRDPLRAFLAGSQLTTRVRCIVLTKGLPHRVQDTDNPNNGDLPGNQPGQFIPELLANDATEASVDVELMLLWQNLNAGEAGNSSDSKADGLIVNPYWRNARSINTYTNQHITSAKTFAGNGVGPTWTLTGTAGSPARLNQGDIYLVSRLDGDTVADVQAALARAQQVHVNTNTAAVLLDEDGGDLDNIDDVFPALYAGDDYEQTQTALVNDRRFSFAFPSPPANVRYDNASGAANFFVGPNLAFAPGNGNLVTSPVILLATYGANHAGVPTLAAGGSAATVYAASFNYPNGAVFNTIESYNCRDFGGLGQLGFAQQQQAADFIGSGGTFAVGNVWEPLADTVPDNLYLAQNFVLGNMSWAEAAWTSIPGLSWMQIALGDPVTRATRTNEDIDTNNRLTHDDAYAWESLASGAAAKDVNRSGAADNADRALVLASVRAAERVNLTAFR
ncbi:MAG TPA: hypothetical protein VD971_08980 [Phycisphaerales bacterium]|nr:hypothetical protein [Phycisphaerales bacterium]